MTEEQKAAYVNAQASAALIKAMGMTAENTSRLQQGYTIAYTEEAFQLVIEEHGIYHNAMLGLFYQ